MAAVKAAAAVKEVKAVPRQNPRAKQRQKPNPPGREMVHVAGTLPTIPHAAAKEEAVLVEELIPQGVDHKTKAHGRPPSVQLETSYAPNSFKDEPIVPTKLVGDAKSGIRRSTAHLVSVSTTANPAVVPKKGANSLISLLARIRRMLW